MTRKAFVIGHPIAHSRSPLIHNFWLKQYGIDGRYDPIDVAPDDLAAFADRCSAGEFVGGNVTIPHKEKIFRLCDQIDDKARLIGAVNTLICNDGAISGWNTDWLGFAANLDEKAPGWDDAAETAIVLGAGGAARAIIVALLQRGFRNIHILNRSEPRARQLAQELGTPQQIVKGCALSSFDKLAPQADLVVNTTSIGMHHTRFDGMDLALLPKHAVVTDIVYIPLITPLLADARALGLQTVDGLGMLLHQAAPGFQAWFGVLPAISPELRNLVEQSIIAS